MFNKIIKTPARTLTKTEISSALQLLNSEVTKSHNPEPWIYTGSEIRKKFVIKNFESTCAFLAKINLRSHLLGHHPNVEYCYNKVVVSLTTHDVGGVSDVDVSFAKRIEKYSNAQ